MSYIPYPHHCSPAFRQAVLERYPGVSGATEFWPMLEHAIFGPYYRDERGERYHILSHQMVARMVGVSPKHHGFTSHEWIDRFSREVMDLHATAWDAEGGIARRIHPEVDPEIVRLALADLCHTEGERVWFATGKPATPYARHKLLRQREAALRQQVMVDLAEPHPANDTIHYLNELPPNTLERLLALRWDDLMAAAHELEDPETKRHSLAVLTGIHEQPRLIYGAAEKTARIYAQDVNV
jgi:hypothetical protein